MKEAPGYAIVYDVTDDRERGKVSKILTGYGFRVQKSVFECKLSRANKRALVERLERLPIRTGSVKLYRIYGGVEHTVIGQPMLDKDGDTIYAF